MVAAEVPQAGVGVMGTGTPSELIWVLVGGCVQRVEILGFLLHLRDMITAWGNPSPGRIFGWELMVNGLRHSEAQLSREMGTMALCKRWSCVRTAVHRLVRQIHGLCRILPCSLTCPSSLPIGP